MLVGFAERDILIEYIRMTRKETTLLTYEKFTNLIYYSKNLINKFPKSERFDLCTDIKSLLYTILRNIIYAWKEYNNYKRLEILKQIDVDLIVLKSMIRLSYNYTYITNKNFMVWDSKIAEIGRLIGGWIKTCQKE